MIVDQDSYDFIFASYFRILVYIHDIGIHHLSFYHKANTFDYILHELFSHDYSNSYCCQMLIHISDTYFHDHILHEILIVNIVQFLIQAEK